jgi:hypothetical protein
MNASEDYISFRLLAHLYLLTQQSRPVSAAQHDNRSVMNENTVLAE